MQGTEGVCCPLCLNVCVHVRMCWSKRVYARVCACVCVSMTLTEF